jgi:putative PIN family toxin of toxin-antitoxin system
MEPRQIVVDTNVLYAALRSRRGASYRLLSQVDSGKFQTNLSVPLFMEYEDVAKRLPLPGALRSEDIDAVLDYLCQVSNKWQIHYLWRPTLPDPKDEMILELAVASNCDSIVTFNVSDFRGADKFGVRALTPHAFLTEIGELP